MTNATYPVVIVEAGDSWLDPVTELDPVESLEDAKAAAREAGYCPIAPDDHGNTETREHGERTVHLVTVEPLAAVAARRRYDGRYRIEDKENAWMGDTAVTMFTAYERQGGAYIHAGRFAAPGHDATDAECVETVETSA